MAVGYPSVSTAWAVLATSTSIAASWNPRARSARSAARSSLARTARSTAVLSPLKEKAYWFAPPRSSSWSIGPREAEPIGPSLLGQPLDPGTAGIAQLEQVRDLVERLACRVIEGLSQEAVASPLRYVEQHRVAAAHQETNERRRQQRVLEHWSEQVPLEVVDAEQRTIEAEGERLPVHHADQERARPVRGPQ